MKPASRFAGSVSKRSFRFFENALRKQRHVIAPLSKISPGPSRRVLLDASVSIGTFAITPEGPGERSEYLTLMDYALDFAHTPDEKTDALLEELNAKMRPATSCHFKFTSNRDYFRGLRIPDDPTSGPIANTIFSTDGYLTWNQYIKVDPDEAHETLRLSGGVSVLIRPVATRTATGIAIEDLRQTHLPLAALGQFRGSLCWLSHTGRHPDKCADCAEAG